MEPQLIELDKEVIYLVNNIPIKVYQGNTVINLIDYMPLLKNGYTNYEQFENLTYIYKHIGGISNVITKVFPLGKLPQDFHLLYKHDTDDIKNKLRDTYFMAMLNKEINMMRSVINWYTKFKQHNLESFFSYNFNINWNNILLAEDKVKLYVAIIKQDVDLVNLFMNEIDPRFDNYEAYKLAQHIDRLAQHIDGKTIIEAVKIKIIQLNLLYDLVLETQLIGYEQVAEDIKLSKYI